MKPNYKKISIICFILSIPSLIIVDWYFQDYGLLSLSTFITLGLVFDQVNRIQSTTVINSSHQFKVNRYLKLVALILFIQVPVTIIYINQIKPNLGLLLGFTLILLGIIVDQIARIKFTYIKGVN